MQDEIRAKIISAFLLVLKPMVRILLRFGIGYREFNEIAKTAFVGVASADYGIRGRPTNMSRVAVMTGLTRKEVRRIRNELESGQPEIPLNNTPLLRLLHVWVSDNEFLNRSGSPKELPFNGGKGSFTQLVKVTGGDIPPGALRTELKRLGAVEEFEDGKLKLLSRTILPSEAHENLVETLVHCVFPTMSMVAHNTDPNRAEPSWPNRTAFSFQIRASELPRFRRIAADRVYSFAENMDDILVSYEVLRDDVKSESKDELKTVHIGAFYFQGDVEQFP
jgi:hypothetical protein